MRKAAFIIPIALITSGCTLAPYAIPQRHLRHGTPSLQAAQPDGRWDHVMRLPANAVIEVLTADGRLHVGDFVRADVQIVWVHAGGAVRELTRDDIVRVDLIALPGSKTTAVMRRGAFGALLGAAGMTVLVGVIGSELWPPPGALVRAGAAGGAYSSGQAELIRRQPRVIYVAPQFRW